MKKKNLWSMAAITLIALLSVGLTSCSKDDDDEVNILGVWYGTPISTILASGDIEVDFGSDGTFTWTNSNGSKRVGKYTLSERKEAIGNGSQTVVTVQWNENGTTEYTLSNIKSSSMMLTTPNYAMYSMRRSKDGSDNGDNGGDNGSGSANAKALIGKTFNKQDGGVNSSGGAYVDKVQITFTTATACTMRCWGEEVFIYSDGSSDKDKYDTGVMEGSYTVTGNKVHINCYSTKYSQSYERDETIANGGLVGFY